MRLHVAAAALAAIVAAPALAGDAYVVQQGAANWTASNQYSDRNRMRLFQDSTSADGNNYAAVVQHGTRNRSRVEQSAITDNTLNVDQDGDRSYVRAFQFAGRVNSLQLKQTNLSRR